MHQARCGVGRQGLEHGGSDASLRVVVLDHDEPALGDPRRFAQRLHVDGLDRVQVDHPRGNLFRRERIRRGEAAVQGHARADQRDLVPGALPHDSGPAHLEGLVGAVERRIRAAGRAHEDDPRRVGHGSGQPGGLIRVAGIEHGRAVDRPHHRQVLERHLRRPVLPDLDAGVRADQSQVGLRDGRHPDEVVRAREEGGERGRERLVAADAHADRGRHELLLGDPHLEEPVRVRLPKFVGVRRVGHLAVHGHDFRDRRQRQQRVAVGLAGRDLVFHLVDRQHRLVGRDPLRRDASVRLLGLDLQVADATQLLDRALRHVRRQGLAVPAVLVLDLGESLALDRLGDDHARLVGVGQGLAERAVDGRDVVAVDHDREAAEGLDPAPVGVEAPAVLGLAALAEPVDVPDGGQVAELVVAGLVHRFPDRTLGQLGVAAQNPDVERQLVQVLTRQRHADADRKALAERAGRDIDPGDHGGRVALEAGAELAEGHQLGVGDRPHRLEHRVAQRRRVALGIDQVVVVRVPWLAPVVLQVARDEDRDEVRGRHRGRRMA